MHSDELQDDTGKLLTRLAAGDESARDPLLERHRSRLAQMVRLRMDDRLRARFDPSDVVQEALVIAANRLKEYATASLETEAGSMSSLSAEQDRAKGEKQAETPQLPLYLWLRKIAWEQFLKFHERHVLAAKRSIHREVATVPGLNDESVIMLADRLIDPIESPSQEILKMEKRVQVRQALEQISHRDREVIELRYLEHLSNSEIATVLNLTPAAVRTRHFRAIQRLHQALNA